MGVQAAQVGQQQPCGLVLLVQAQGLVQEVHILEAVQPVEEEYAEQRLTLVVSTSTLIAAALGYTRRYRRMFFIQQCLFKHMRRYLVTLDPTDVDVELRGVLPRFRACWRVLTRASNEVFYHPLTGELVYDLGLTRRQLLGAADVAVAFTLL